MVLEPSFPVGELPPDVEQSIREAHFIEAGVAPADVPEVARTYASVVTELRWHADVICAATAGQKVILLNEGVDLGEWERFRAAWKHRRTHICAPDPVVLREAGRRVAGIHPPVPASNETDLGMCSIRFALASVRLIRRDDQTN